VVGRGGSDGTDILGVEGLPVPTLYVANRGVTMKSRSGWKRARSETPPYQQRDTSKMLSTNYSKREGRAKNFLDDLVEFRFRRSSL
jgi:hypothetical protein